MKNPFKVTYKFRVLVPDSKETVMTGSRVPYMHKGVQVGWIQLTRSYETGNIFAEGEFKTKQDAERAQREIEYGIAEVLQK